LLDGGPDWAIVLDLERAPERAPFGAAEAATLARLLPGLGLALRCLSESRATHLKARMFHHLPVGVGLLGADLELLLHNRALHRVLVRGDGLRLAAGRVHACADPDHRELARRVRRATAGMPAAGFLHIGRRSGHPPYLAHIEPFMHRGSGIDPRAVKLVVLDPTAGNRGAIVQIGLGFGLSAAEMRVIQALLEGRGVEDIAACLEASPHTVRWHLKRIFRKTDVASQAELVRLFMHALQIDLA
jgi:DNA-binding CsgD family transcriptional regulator